MRPVSSLGAEEARHLLGLLFDLDDTLLTHGLLTRSAYDALWSLGEAGLKLVAVTGRPTGWGAVLARQWPIAGCVTENGAMQVVREGGGVAVIDSCTPEERSARSVRLARLVEDAQKQVPEARLTDDVGARRSDVTWDVGERARLPEKDIATLVALLQRGGARTLRSSVHLHATFDTDDKASGALRFCASQLGEDPGSARSRFAFVGDSGNDASCFAAFHTTFGVANVFSSLSSLALPPRYVATQPMGEGFAEIAAEILRKK
jgi:hydroxymethylpyrimidine pyrophosphatase-like HAD family hydrolase